MNKTEEKIYELLKSNVLFRDEKGIYTIFPQKLLIKASGKSERTVQYALKKLEEQKYIVREVYKEINLVKFYFSQEEELKNSHIIDRRKSCTSPSENYTFPSENYTFPSENCTSLSENCTSLSENCTSPTETEDSGGLTNISCKNDEVRNFKEISQTIKKAPTPEKYILPTYKLVDVLFSGELPLGIETPVNMASEKDNRKGKTAYTLMMLNFDELGDGIKISRELSVYDQQVWNACVNLILNSYKIITPSQIYRWMGYEKQMNDRDKKRIMESVNAIIRARVFIDNENERKLYKNYPAISINTPLLAAKIVTAKSGKNEVTAIEIIEIPDLFAVAEERGQITTIPFEVLEISEIDRTEENLKLLTYLVRRIIHMKYDNDTSRKILLQAIYAKCDIKADERMKRKRLPEKIERIFNHYKKIKWIDGYELTDTEVTVKLPKKK
ncbi:MAG: hypothetical protein IIT39_14900 [Clostridia bacterium]|nr:hypothetical protein [Clostridia bacterium]